MNIFNTKKDHLFGIFFIILTLAFFTVDKDYPIIINAALLMSNILTFIIIIYLESYTVLNFIEGEVVLNASKNQNNHIKYNEITKIFNYQNKIIEIVVNDRRSYFVPLCRIDSQFHEEIRIRFKKIMRDQIKKKKTELSGHILDWDEVKQYFKSGQQEYAIECGENLIKNIKGEYPLNHTLLATSLIDMANLYEKQKNYKEAVTLLKQALSIREKMFGINNPKALEVFEMLASVPKY